jgi:hypothetical protein
MYPARLGCESSQYPDNPELSRRSGLAPQRYNRELSGPIRKYGGIQ